MQKKKQSKHGTGGRKNMSKITIVDYRELSITDNSVNLCDSCVNQIPECWNRCEIICEVIFGDGKGYDNICCCNGYKPLATKTSKDKE